MPAGGRQSDALSLGGRVQSGAWGREALDASRDREDALRAQRPQRPSSSVVPSRCTACREWSSDDGAGRCGKCGCPWEPAPLVGLARVTDSAYRHR